MKLPANYDLLSPPERRQVQEEYARRQKGKCYHCKSPLTESPHESALSKKVNRRLFPETFFQWPVHLHHSHATGMTIGAVHCHCNAVLWQYHGE